MNANIEKLHKVLIAFDFNLAPYINEIVPLNGIKNIDTKRFCEIYVNGVIGINKAHTSYEYYKEMFVKLVKMPKYKLKKNLKKFKKLYDNLDVETLDQIVEQSEDQLKTWENLLELTLIPYELQRREVRANYK